MPTLTPEQLQDARRKSGKLGGRPRKPRPTDLERERIERILDRAWGVLEESLEDEDTRMRLQAAKEAFDRIYGRPQQTLAGEGDQPLAIVIEEIPAYALLGENGSGD